MTQVHLTSESYKHVKRVCNKFSCINQGEFIIAHICASLRNVFEQFSRVMYFQLWTSSSAIFDLVQFNILCFGKIYKSRIITVN